MRNAPSGTSSLSLSLSDHHGPPMDIRSVCTALLRSIAAGAQSVWSGLRSTCRHRRHFCCCRGSPNSPQSSLSFPVKHIACAFRARVPRVRSFPRPTGPSVRLSFSLSPSLSPPVPGPSPRVTGFLRLVLTASKIATHKNGQIMESVQVRRKLTTVASGR